MTSFNITTVSTILTCISILFIELHKNEEKIFHFQQKKKNIRKKRIQSLKVITFLKIVKDVEITETLTILEC